MNKPGASLNDGRFWGTEQDADLTPVIPRHTQIAVIKTLIACDALDLAPMLLAPINGPRGEG